MDGRASALVASAPMLRAEPRTASSSLSPSAWLPLLLALTACGSPPAPTAPEPGAATPSATASAPEAATPELTKRSGASVFVVHEVSDFAAFQKFFEDGAAERDAAGIEGYLLTRLEDGRVVIHLFAADAAKVQAALNSERMQSYLSRSGAPDASLVWVARDEVVFLPSKPPAGATFSLYFKRRARDAAAFRQAFEQRTSAFAKRGMLGFGLHQSVTQPEVVILHFMAATKASLEALPNQPELSELLALTEDAAFKPLIGEDVLRGRPAAPASQP